MDNNGIFTQLLNYVDQILRNIFISRKLIKLQFIQI